MIEGTGFHEHVDRIEGMLKQIQGADDRISSLFPSKADEAGSAELNSKVTRFADELEKEVDYFKGIYDRGDASSVDIERLNIMKALLPAAIGSLEAQKERFGDKLGNSYLKLENTLQMATFLTEILPTLKEPAVQNAGGVRSRRSAHHTRRRQQLARRRGGQGRQLVLEDIADVINFVNSNKDTIFADAKAGAIYHRQNIHAEDVENRTDFRHSFQVLNSETASSPDEMVIVVHQKPKERVRTRKKKMTNVMHIGIGGEKTVKRSVMVDIGSRKSAYVAVATSRQDVRHGKRLVDKERKALEALAGKPGIIELRGHAVYRVKQKEGVSEPLPEKMNMVLAYADSDLRGVLSRGKLSEHYQQNFALEMLTGLVAVHQEGLIHYDLKIDNVFVVNGHPKIGDFGSSEKVGIPVTRRGTRNIVPPEMHRLIEASKSKDDLVEEQGVISPRLDVFEMGVILYHMKHGHEPKFSYDIDVAAKKAWDEFQEDKNTGKIPENSEFMEDHEGYARLIEKWHDEEKPMDEEDEIIFNMLHPKPDFRPSAQDAFDRLSKLYRDL